jgi:hypothetical protein
VASVLSAIFDAKDRRGLSIRDVAAGSRLSERTVTYASGLRVRSSLRTLLALADSVGLELDIRVRAKRPKSTPFQEGMTHEG